MRGKLELSVEYLWNIPGVGISHRCWAQRFWEGLVGDRSLETLNCQSAHAGGGAIGSSWERSTVNHCVAYFDTGGPTTEENASGNFFYVWQQLLNPCEVAFGSLEGSRELSSEAINYADEVIARVVAIDNLSAS